MSDEESGSQNFCLGPDFIGFDGHFPDYPVLPAMLQVLLGIIVSEDICGTRLTLQKLDKAKFMAQIRPEQNITVSCHLSRADSDDPQPAIKARVIISTTKQKMASMTLFFNQP